jgi:putative transposase
VVGEEAYSSGLANLATALSNRNASKTGKRRGPKVRFPRFTGKRHGMSCRFTTGAFGLSAADRRHVRLPRIGTIRTQNRPGNSLGTSSTVGRVSVRRRCRTGPDAGGCRSPYRSPATTPRRRSPTPWSGRSGHQSLAVLSTGEVIANPRHLELAQRERRRLQRQASRRVRIGGPGRSPRRGGARPRSASPACTPPSRTRAAMACTNSPPAWYAVTERS